MVLQSLSGSHNQDGLCSLKAPRLRPSPLTAQVTLVAIQSSDVAITAIEVPPKRTWMSQHQHQLLLRPHFVPAPPLSPYFLSLDTIEVES